MPLLTVENQIPAATDAEAAPRRFWRSIIPLEQAMAAPMGPPEIAINVYANHGRWVVECPDCSEAQMACATDYRFMCNLCANVSVEGMWRAVIWPEERAEIDGVLSGRRIVNQNWSPGEMLDELRAEEPLPTKGKSPRRGSAQ